LRIGSALAGRLVCRNSQIDPKVILVVVLRACCAGVIQWCGLHRTDGRQTDGL
jgi:hypothetical protein